MELVPEDELETSIPTGPNAFADRRAKKVCFYLYIAAFYMIRSMIFANMVRWLFTYLYTHNPPILVQIARFKRQKAAESKLLELKERKERRGRSTKASALSTPVEVGEEDVLDEDGEEEREVSHLCFYLMACADEQYL